MGLLDDAIREHLELKRQHGAKEDELRRQEAEALGPARREFSAAEPAAVEVDEEIAPAEEIVSAEEPPPAVAPPVVGSVPPEPEPPPEVEPEIASDPGLDEPPFPREPEAPGPDPEPLHEDLAPPEEPRRDLSTVGQDTEEHFFEELEDERPAAEVQDHSLKEQGDKLDETVPDRDVLPDTDSDEDLLEATPEFLEETPEHDRLWFEQKPPRDFDFD